MQAPVAALPRFAIHPLQLQICKILCSVMYIGTHNVEVQQEKRSHCEAFVAHCGRVDIRSSAVEVDSEKRRNTEHRIKKDDAYDSVVVNRFLVCERGHTVSADRASPSWRCDL
jgi:hypothetical protein